MNDKEGTVTSIIQATIQSKSGILLKSLTKYYWNNKNINKLLSIINGSSDISLRILDWFVTNYCKKNKIKYYVNDMKKDFIVYINYKAQLKAYNKKLFDPFCRHDRINFRYEENKQLETTIGQLNFFRWAINNKIIDYVTEHLNKIEKDMILSKKEREFKKNKKEKNLKKRLIQLSESDSPSNNQIIVSNIHNNNLINTDIHIVNNYNNGITLVFE